MMPLPGNPSWERNLRTRSRRTRQHSIVFVHFCTYVDGTCSFDQPKRNLENVKVRLCTAIFSISFALHTHTRWMNIMNHQHTGQRMDKEWTKNGQRMDKEWTKNGQRMDKVQYIAVSKFLRCNCCNAVVWRLGSQSSCCSQCRPASSPSNGA